MFSSRVLKWVPIEQEKNPLDVTLHIVVVQDAGEKLKSVQHERAALQKQRDALARQLAHVSEKISSGIIPDASDLAVPEHIAAAAEASASVVGHLFLWE